MSSGASLADRLPCNEAAFFHTHPSNLAVVATLCGLDPPPVETCRVLELGCGSGFNLLPMAFSLPGTRLVGVDLSQKQIDHGRAAAAALGVKKLELHAVDVATLDPGIGTFDYIIAHGFMSWVPPAVREAVFEICARQLAPGGIAYLSYNTYPGWHIRGLLRDAIRFHAPSGGSPLERLRAARAGLDRLVASLPEPDSLYAQFLRAEAEAFRSDPDVYAVHEHVVDDNHPLRFEEFAAQAAANGLQFVVEARFGTNSFTQPPEVQELLNAASNDLVRREQYHDLLRNRSFRQSLVCHAGTPVPRAPSLAALLRLRVHRRVEPAGAALTVDGSATETFRLDGDAVIATADPVVRAILATLHETGPRPISFEELTARVVERTGSAAMHVMVRLLSGYGEGLWHFYAFDPPFGATAGDRPCACPLVRNQASRGSEVTNRLHRPVQLSEAERTLIQRLDGATPRKSLTGEPESVEVSLHRFAAAALLEA